jgi:hypothetical protein
MRGVASDEKRQRDTGRTMAQDNVRVVEAAYDLEAVGMRE